MKRSVAVTGAKVSSLDEVLLNVVPVSVTDVPPMVREKVHVPGPPPVAHAKLAAKSYNPGVSSPGVRERL